MRDKNVLSRPKETSMFGSNVGTDNDELDIEFGIDKSAYVAIIDRLTDTYDNPAVSMTREIYSNAYDANMKRKMADGHEGKIVVTLPEVDNDFTLSIADEGLGMSMDMLRTIYTRFGTSDKTDDLNSVGAYGMGAKSPWALVEQFSVRTVTREEVIEFTALRHKGSVPKLTNIVRTDNTDNTPTGTVVSIPLGGMSSFDREHVCNTATTLVNFSIDFDAEISNGVEESVGNKPLDNFGKNKNIKDDYVYVTSLQYDDVELRIFADISVSCDSYVYTGNGVSYMLNGAVYNSYSMARRLDEVRDIVVELKPGIVDFPSSRDSIVTNDRFRNLQSSVSKALKYIDKNLVSQWLARKLTGLSSRVNRLHDKFYNKVEKGEIDRLEFMRAISLTGMEHMLKYDLSVDIDRNCMYKALGYNGTVLDNGDNVDIDNRLVELIEHILENDGYDLYGVATLAGHSSSYRSVTMRTNGFHHYGGSLTDKKLYRNYQELVDFRKEYNDCEENVESVDNNLDDEMEGEVFTKSYYKQQLKLPKNFIHSIYDSRAAKVVVLEGFHKRYRALPRSYERVENFLSAPDANGNRFVSVFTYMPIEGKITDNERRIFKLLQWAFGIDYEEVAGFTDLKIKKTSRNSTTDKRETATVYTNQLSTTQFGTDIKAGVLNRILRQGSSMFSTSVITLSEEELVDMFASENTIVIFVNEKKLHSRSHVSPMLRHIVNEHDVEHLFDNTHPGQESLRPIVTISRPRVSLLKLVEDNDVEYYVSGLDKINKAAFDDKAVNPTFPIRFAPQAFTEDSFMYALSCKKNDRYTNPFHNFRRADELIQSWEDKGEEKFDISDEVRNFIHEVGSYDTLGGIASSDIHLGRMAAQVAKEHDMTIAELAKLSNCNTEKVQRFDCCINNLENIHDAQSHNINTLVSALSNSYRTREVLEVAKVFSDNPRKALVEQAARNIEKWARDNEML